jgi:uncharacterized membrane protein YfcA
MTLDLPLVAAGLITGVLVGLTGMGGGAVMTPMLVFFFGVDPLTAISSDLVVSLLMRPIGAFVHLRRGTVNLHMVKWLCVGSVPAAFSGAVLISLVPPDVDVDTLLQRLLGVALLVATAGLITRALMQMWSHQLPWGEGVTRRPLRPIVVPKPVPTLLLGAVAGLMVGLTSVGAGSIVVVGLLLMHPGLQASALVGTDLVQAIPMVGSAAAGHLLFGDFSFGIAGSLLVGAIPGTWLGAHISTRAPGGVIRRILAVLLLASALKLLGFSNDVTLLAAVLSLVLGSLVWIVIRNQARRSRSRAAAAAKAARAEAKARSAEEATG